MYISVTTLFERGKRRSNYAVRCAVPVVGWLHYEVEDGHVRAKLLDDKSAELLALDRARLVASRGVQGALIEGVEYRKKGRKHSISDQQAWWCEAPPRTLPLMNHLVRVEAAERLYEREMAAWRREVDGLPTD